VYCLIHNVINLYSIRRSLYCVYFFQSFFFVLDLCCKCADLHPRGEAVRRSFVSNVLEDIENTENMDFWMKEGLEELEEVRTEKSNLFTIKENSRGVTERSSMYVHTPTIAYTDKKENEIFRIHKEIQMGSVAKSYMRKGFLLYMYEEMRKYLSIYEEAVSHI
jgi:hypothetical protein